MEKLIEGVLRFQREIYPRDRALYRKLASGQSPRWLAIACSDSRVDPSTLTQVQPGELFVCRNAGNIVPPHRDHSGGVSATIEYAVQVLGVKHILVCGHSDCGAMKAVLHPEKVAGLPAVSTWIGYADRARAVALEMARSDSEEVLLAAITEENVLAQLDNLRTHPSVAAKLKAGTLEIHGWVFGIEGGEIKAWDGALACWRPLHEIAEPSSRGRAISGASDVANV
jgi:carbonic anhydrase